MFYHFHITPVKKLVLVWPELGKGSLSFFMKTDHLRLLLYSDFQVKILYNSQQWLYNM